MNGKQVAKLNYLRIAPRKVRLVADLVRGLSVNEAEAQLLIQRKRAARPLLKLLRSAAANAKNAKRDPNHMYIETLVVDGGPMLKRFLPRARGSASPIQKKMSHVTMILGEKTMGDPRFTIQVVKKAKIKKEIKEKDANKEKAPKDDRQVVQEKKKSGFLKRIFSPKSRAAK